MKSQEFNPLAERERILNQAGEEEQRINRDYKREQRIMGNDTKKEEDPKFKRTLLNTLFKSRYSSILIGFVLLLINVIGRFFTLDLIFIVPSLVYVGLLLYTITMIDPILFASDNKHYIKKVTNATYAKLSVILSALLKNIGFNLDKSAKSSRVMCYSILIIGSLLSLVTYESSILALMFPVLFVYLLRVFGGNHFKEERIHTTRMKWLSVLLITIQSILSIIQRVPMDYTLLTVMVVITLLNVWFSNTHIYTWDEVAN